MQRLTTLQLLSWQAFSFSTTTGWLTILSNLVNAVFGAVGIMWLVRLALSCHSLHHPATPAVHHCLNACALTADRWPCPPDARMRGQPCPELCWSRTHTHTKKHICAPACPPMPGLHECTGVRLHACMRACMQVERAKKCLDFASTCYFVHFLTVWITQGFPASFTWCGAARGCAAPPITPPTSRHATPCRAVPCHTP